MGSSSSKPVCFEDEVNLNHFRLLRVVGKGAFGKVRIVERKDTNLQFALKYIRKDEIVKSESVRNILRERRMLENLNYQFICNLRYSFQDYEYMYMVIDLMNGGDLRFHISRKTFTEEAVKFWIAEIGLALRYIHQHKIVHRDVKPDNVLLDSEGHIHLADFNVASDFQPGKPLSSKSGTLAYLAPEVYKSTGYGPGADWWSLGVLFYECIYNKRPFSGDTQTVLAAQITQAAPKFPITDPPVSMPCLHAISSALEEDPAKRMGSMSFYSFTDNPFFRDIDFVALENKEIEPVFVPSAEKTNFDATYDLEELLLEEAPLEARARRQKPREQLKDDATKQQVHEENLFKMIEREFLPFDYTTAALARYAEASAGDPNSNSTERDQGQHPVENGKEGNVARSVSKHSTTRKRRDSKAESYTSESPPMPTQSLRSVPIGQQSAPSYGKKATGLRQANNTQQTAPARSNAPLSPYQASYNRSQRPSGSRKESMGGGMQVVLGETGSWSELAKNDTTLPADAKTEVVVKSGGMLGIFKGKKGRGHSPKPQERGILGKEGARVVISNGD